MCIISARKVPNFEIKDYPFFAVMKSFEEAQITAVLFSGQRHSPFFQQDIYQFFFKSNRIFIKSMGAQNVRFFMHMIGRTAPLRRS